MLSQQIIETHLPHLSQPQLTGLALWVCGAILAGSACQNAVASALSPWGRWNSLRQYREWLYDGSDRARPCQGPQDVTLCFAPLLSWVLAWWHSGRLALAVDPTLKGSSFSVVYRGCAIPVAWRIMRANRPGAWMDPIVELLRELVPAVPEEMTVIVLCDRGLASPKLWQQILAQSLPRRAGRLAGPPYMRGYPKNITFSPQGGQLPASCPPSVSRHFVPRAEVLQTQRVANQDRVGRQREYGGTGSQSSYRGVTLRSLPSTLKGSPLHSVLPWFWWHNLYPPCPEPDEPQERGSILPRSFRPIISWDTSSWYALRAVPLESRMRLRTVLPAERPGLAQAAGLAIPFWSES